MKRKAKIQIVEVLSEYSQEMMRTSGYDLKWPLREKLYGGNAKDPCKTEMLLHLKDGVRIILDNRHKASTEKQEWCGDEIANVRDLIPELYDNVDYLDVLIREPGKNHRMRIPLESVAWVELYQELPKE